jgi:hypothetical protein
MTSPAGEREDQVPPAQHRDVEFVDAPAGRRERDGHLYGQRLPDTPGRPPIWCLLVRHHRRKFHSSTDLDLARRPIGNAMLGYAVP